MLWVGLTLLLVTSLGVPASALDVPRELAGLPLSHFQQGSEARAEIERLHERNIPVTDGYVAHYGTQPPVAMLYVSQARDEQEARQQVEQMTTRIRASTGPFTHLRESTRFGITVYSTLGQGQVHYYFRRGGTVVWVAADPPIAQPALADAVVKLKTGTADERRCQSTSMETTTPDQHPGIIRVIVVGFASHHPLK